MVVHLTSPDGRYDTLYLRNYARLHVRDRLARIPGVGEAQLFGGGDYIAPVVSIAAVVGFIGLAGIVVNDSLVLIDFVNKERERGTPALEAVLVAGRRRFRARSGNRGTGRAPRGGCATCPGHACADGASKRDEGRA